MAEIARQTLTNISVTTDATSTDLFGADMLRFRGTDNFEITAEEAGVGRIRWPGEGIVDPRPADTRWINEYDADGVPTAYVFDLKHDNIIDTTGWPRDGLREAMEYAVAAEMGFSMLVPEERYMKVDVDATNPADVFSIDFTRVEADLTVFLNRLLEGHFGPVPADFTVQLGQEYYTGPLADLVSTQGFDHQSRMEATGALYNFMAGFIKDHVASKTANGQNPDNVEVGVAVQIGRFLRAPEGDPAFGSSDDVAILAAQFDAAGAAAVDELLFQRYVPRLEGAADGLSDGPAAQSLDAALDVWADRITGLGLSHDPEITVGWAKSAYTRSEARADYTGSVTQEAFQNRTNEDFERFYQSHLEDRHDLGEKLPSMMLEFLDELITAGVNNGFYYGFDTQYVGALTRTDVNGAPVTLLGGTFFSWLTEELVGQVRVGHDLDATRQADTANIYTFANDQEISVFLAANVLTGGHLSHQLDLAQLIQAFGPLRLDTAQSLTAEIPEDWRTRFGVADLDAQFGAGFQDAEAQAFAVARMDPGGALPEAASHLSGGILTTEFQQDFEVAGLSFVRGQGYDFSGLSVASVGDPGQLQTGDFAALVVAGATSASILTGASDDVTFGSSQADTFGLGGGDDRSFGSGGADQIDGGLGLDVVDYWTSAQGLLVDLQLPQLNSGIAAGDTYISIEGIKGSSFADTLRGDRHANTIWGGDGVDVLHGRLGDDQLFGEAGNDVLLGGAGADTIDGGAGVDRVAYWTDTGSVTVDLFFDELNGGAATGDVFSSIEDIQGTGQDDDLRGDHGRNRVWAGEGADVLHGRKGNDVLRGQGGDDIILGGPGADWINGGAGIDRAAYWTAGSAVEVDLADSSRNSGDAAGDSFVGIEHLQGSMYNDALSGDAGDNRIWGGAGNDRITGRAGDDLLLGQSGADVFVFISGDTGVDRVADFEIGLDLLDISAWGVESFASLAIETSISGIKVSFEGNTLILDDLSTSSLSSSDLIFA